MQLLTPFGDMACKAEGLHNMKNKKCKILTHYKEINPEIEKFLPFSKNFNFISYSKPHKKYLRSQSFALQPHSKFTSPLFSAKKPVNFLRISTPSQFCLFCTSSNIFMHGIHTPVHKSTKKILRFNIFDLPLVQSFALQPEWREYISDGTKKLGSFSASQAYKVGRQSFLSTSCANLRFANRRPFYRASSFPIQMNPSRAISVKNTRGLEFDELNLGCKGRTKYPQFAFKGYSWRSILQESSIPLLFESDLITFLIQSPNASYFLTPTEVHPTRYTKLAKRRGTSNTKVFPGQLVAFGSILANNIVTTESGQVLYIDSQKTTIRKAQTVLIYSQAIIAVLAGEWIKKGTPLMSLSYQKLVTGDIVQGLPKIEQFFEAPVLKDGTFWSDSLQAKLNQYFQEQREHLPLAEAVRKGFSEIQRFLVEGVQRVYISQGVLIADKHLEVIVRQMTCKGRILYSGDTGFLRNELVSLDKIENVNQVTYGQKALYHPQVRGITDASLESESFLSAASFQETTRVLSRDAIIGKTDLMRGLKERVIVGELIQAGTGLATNSVYNFL